MTTIRYQLTEQEAVRGMLKVRRFASRGEDTRTVIIVGMLALLTVSWGIHHLGRGKALPFMCVIAGCIVIVLLILTPFYIQHLVTRAIRSNPDHFTDPQEITFDEKGMVGGSAAFKQELAWTVFKRRAQDDDFIYLYSDIDSLMAIVPKRAFTGSGVDGFLRCSQSLLTA